MTELPKQYIVAPNCVPSPLLTHMMNKRRNAESKAPCANQCEAQAFKVELRMGAARITELESILRRQHEAIQKLRDIAELMLSSDRISSGERGLFRQALKDTEGLV